MIKKILIALLTISFLIEALLSFFCFFMPDVAFKQMHLLYSQQYALPAFLIGWFLLLVTCLLMWVIYAVIKEKPGYKNIIYILGFWWIAIGVSIYFFSGLATNLFSDSLKGFLLIVAAYIYKKAD
jgi:hypothetical protein